MPHQVKLAAYNAAGELVKIIYEGSAQYLPGALSLNADKFIGGSGSVQISFPGVFATGSSTVGWSGVNDSAMLVKGGVYTIKAEITDQWGQTTALVRTVQVIPGGVQQTLRIYNGAGELVRSVPVAGPVVGATRLEPATDSYALEIDPVTGKATQPYRIDVVGNGGPVSAAWDGLNDRGVPVASGSYTIQLVSNEGGRETVVTSRSVSVLKTGEDNALLAGAVIGPNPSPPGQAPVLVYNAALLPAGRQCSVLIFNLAGELIGQASDGARTGRLRLPLDRAQAGGVYLVRFTVETGPAVLQSRVMKLAILR
jgi:flagellar hook assembly protein FlgD